MSSSHDRRRRPRRASSRRVAPERTTERTTEQAAERAGERAAQQVARRERRLALRPEITYPEHLPVVERREDIAAAIRDHQVVVVAGETGSGKTTQIPKICLELGRGIDGAIGHTQPRRIAARAVAERLADELEVELGGAIGYRVRFTDVSSRDSLVTVMTDGILLAELQRDRDLRRYDTIIIDEAHERSLNIDFLLGYLKKLLPRRPDLKVIVTSATIDPERFARHFTDREGRPAPIIEVSGRTYPVEVRYRPLVREQAPGQPLVEIDQVTGICDAVEELWTEASGHDEVASHDILVFLSGEREIRDAADALAALRLPDTEIVPLFARLSAAEQHRVFARHTGRRVVLATNVAETSLTVPGIRYVVDTGTARISRYSQRTKVQRLPIEPVSKASATQRAGRCGRLADGVCIRLYAEDDFLARPDFTDPEILRTNLASVILQMTTLGLGDVAAFPFVDAPDARQIGDGVKLLEELRAFDDRGGITAYGRTIARLPVDPRLARMLIEADQLGCLAEVLIIVAALSIQDPRERPLDKQELAAAAHKRFADEHSDFMSYLRLWRYLQEQQKALSGSAFRRMCKAEYLHYLRIREWQDLVSQLRQASKSVGYRTQAASGGRAAADDSGIDANAIHQALLAGLLSHIGARDEARRDYLGTRGARFVIAPGSVLRSKTAPFVMAGELVETSRLFARTVAKIDPMWAERLGDHLVKREHAEPRWAARRGSAVATEKVMLLGVPLVVGRIVSLGGIAPELARELFIRHALVEGDWQTRHHFFRDNRALLDRLGELESRTRRRDLIVGDEEIYAFYDERIPAHVVSARHFDTWWKTTRRTTPELLTMTEALLRSDADLGGSADDFPSIWQQGDLALPLSYHFEPGADHDGVSVHIGTEILNQVTSDGFDWQVPGLREELITALIRSLPKPLRRLLVPAPEHAAATLARLHADGLSPSDGPLTEVLARLLRHTHGVAIRPEDWDVDRLPSHLRIRFVIEDRPGHAVATGADLTALKDAASGHVRRALAAAGADVERSGVRTWVWDSVPTTYEAQVRGVTVSGFPAIVDDGDSVSMRVLPTAGEATAEHRLGVRRLVLLATTPPWRAVLARLSNVDKLALGHNPHGSVPALLGDVLAAAVDAIIAERVQRTPRTRAEFEAALAAVRAHVSARVVGMVGDVLPILRTHVQILRTLDSMTAPALAPLVTDIRAQLRELIRPGFVADAGAARLSDVDRYLRAISHRLAKAPEDIARDHARLDEVLSTERSYAALLHGLRPSARGNEAVVAIAWMIEELRVSLFAQSLGTAYPVSVKRIERAIAAIPKE